MSGAFECARLAVLREGMAGRVAAEAGLDEAWLDAFATVPREAFIPALAWRDENGTGVPVDRDEDPEAWTRMLYDEYCSIITQLDDGTGSGRGRYSSSSSMPAVMARMLAELPAAGRILEVGTGTGYNAALLAERYGAVNVTTIEFDEALAERADKALVDAGYPVVVRHGDGVDGLSAMFGGGPFEALICTCSIAHLPGRWLRAVPNGVIVAPFYAGWLPTAVLVLQTGVILPTGVSAALGRFKRDFTFMRARAHRWEGERPAKVSGGRNRTSPLSPHLVTSHTEAAGFFVSLRLPGVDYSIDTLDGVRQLTAWDNEAKQSWAVVEWGRGGDAWAVRESGPRNLWAEVEDAHRTWARLGEPGVDRYEVRVDEDGAHVMLDDRQVAELPMA